MVRYLNSKLDRFSVNLIFFAKKQIKFTPSKEAFCKVYFLPESLDKEKGFKISLYAPNLLIIHIRR